METVEADVFQEIKQLYAKYKTSIDYHIVHGKSKFVRDRNRLIRDIANGIYSETPQHKVMLQAPLISF